MMSLGQLDGSPPFEIIRSPSSRRCLSKKKFNYEKLQILFSIKLAQPMKFFIAELWHICQFCALNLLSVVERMKFSAVE